MATRQAVRKAHAWIFDSFGARRSGMLEIRHDDEEGIRPADKGWRFLAVFPAAPRSADAARVLVWADGADKYIARLDIGSVHRWLILEGLPALLANLESLSALVLMGRGGEE